MKQLNSVSRNDVLLLQYLLEDNPGVKCSRFSSSSVRITSTNVYSNHHIKVTDLCLSKPSLCLLIMRRDLVLDYIQVVSFLV